MLRSIDVRNYANKAIFCLSSLPFTDKAKNRWKTKCSLICIIFWRRNVSFVRHWVLERSADNDAYVTATNYTLSRLYTGTHNSLAFCTSKLQVDTRSLLLPTSCLFIMQSMKSSKRKCLSFKAKLKIKKQKQNKKREITSLWWSLPQVWLSGWQGRQI